jgi:hypothetical protein
MPLGMLRDGDLKLWLPIGCLIALGYLFLRYLPSRAPNKAARNSESIFRFSPVVAWFFVAGGLAFAGLAAFDVFSHRPNWTDTPTFVLLFGASGISIVLYGIYCLLIRYKFDSVSFRVNSLWGIRSIRFDFVGSIVDRNAGKWRTLEIRDARGKRFLYVSSSFLVDYALMVDELERKVRASRDASAGLHNSVAADD